MAWFEIARAWAKFRRLSGRDLWERDLDEFGILRRSGITALRIAAVTRRGFSRHQLTTRAGSLTYVTIFSLVPTLAVAFAMFSAFGGLQHARDALLNRAMDYLAAGVREQVTQGLDRMLRNINGGAIGATGLVFVIIAVFTLLSSIEDVFNDIWGVKRTRGYLERLTLYWTVVTVSPTLIVLGMSLPAVLGNLMPLHWVLERTGTAHVFFDLVVPWAFVIVGFTLLYLLMVARRVRFATALVGGIAGGTLWFAAVHAYTWYAKSTVYYANIYGSLAAIPIFIFWLYLSWLIVFIGAQIAFAWENLDTYREEILSDAPSQVSREHVALAVMTEVARRFVSREPPASASGVAADLHISARSVNEVIGELISLGLLIEVGKEQHLMPTRDPGHVSPAEVLNCLRRHGEQVVSGNNDLVERIRTLYEQANSAADAVWDGTTVADLAGGADRDAAGDHPRGDGSRTQHRSRHQSH